MRSLALASLAALLVAGCGGGPTETVPDGGGGGNNNPGGGGPVLTTSVTLQNSAFVPPAIRVSPAATVTWTNADGILHNVTFTSNAVPSIGNWTSGSRTSTMPTAAGTYEYHCTLHGGMNGSVQVQ
jgi:plastocyanin